MRPFVLSRRIGPVTSAILTDTGPFTAAASTVPAHSRSARRSPFTIIALTCPRKPSALSAPLFAGHFERGHRPAPSPYRRRRGRRGHDCGHADGGHADVVGRRRLLDVDLAEDLLRALLGHGPRGSGPQRRRPPPRDPRPASIGPLTLTISTRRLGASGVFAVPLAVSLRPWT